MTIPIQPGQVYASTTHWMLRPENGPLVVRVRAVDEVGYVSYALKRWDNLPPSITPIHTNTSESFRRTFPHLVES